jgi:hypothetical protein
MPRREGASLASVSGTESGKTPDIDELEQLTDRMSRQRRRSRRVEVETTAGIAGVRCVFSVELVIKDWPNEGFERIFIETV